VARFPKEQTFFSSPKRPDWL